MFKKIILHSPPLPHPNINWAVYPAILWCASCETQHPITRAGVGGRAHCCLWLSLSGSWQEESLLKPGDFRCPCSKCCLSMMCHGKGWSGVNSPLGLFSLDSSGEVAGRPQGAYAASCEVTLFCFCLLLSQHLCLEKISESQAPGMLPAKQILLHF